ncbi:sugar ABC transporter substrate-binding protein [Sediminibacillus albus]|uniref:Multiple sugar transport system substrate-binding protein n=1 Tax=Sediminibacillus albus TaxID=407036 RepID=A0A1G8Y7H8_9BACI|nr:sugar ABC transporter substrate-binding protein [Sediminibacillus albus]SDJ98748.1 multiple sugar transport system substrate-binding protein [Sediminibacillus albus]
MKKFSILVLIIILGTVLAACNSDEDATATDGEISGEITVWVHPFTGDAEAEGAMWDEIVASYEEKYDATVTIETIPWGNRDQKILTALAANNGPDVFYAIPDQMPQYADEGMLVELDPYLEDNKMDGFVDTALVSTKWQDKTYGLPILQEAYTLFYNVDVIEAIGKDPENLPSTWSEFEEWAKAAKEQGFYAYSYQGGGSMNGTLYPFLWQAGGKVITQDDEIMINNAAGVEAFEFINKMYEKEWIPEDSITAMNHDAIWNAGEMLAVQGSGISLTNLQESDLNFVIAPPLKNKEQVTYGTTGMFVVPTNSDNPNAAVEFVKTVTNAENQRKFNTVTQYIPTRESAKDIFDDQKYLSQLAQYTQYALPGVIHPKGRNIMPMIQAEVQTMMEGKKTPQEAADAAAEAIEAEIAK